MHIQYLTYCGTVKKKKKKKLFIMRMDAWESPVRLLRALLLLLAVPVHGAAMGGGEALPNIVWFLTDDQDQMLGASFPELNGGRGPMPKTKRVLQEQEAMAERFYIHTPICNPSRSELLSGRYFHNIKGVNIKQWAMHVNETYVNQHTFVRDLSEQANYHTGMFGKYMNVMPTKHTRVRRMDGQRRRRLRGPEISDVQRRRADPWHGSRWRQHGLLGLGCRHTRQGSQVRMFQRNFRSVKLLRQLLVTSQSPGYVRYTPRIPRGLSSPTSRPRLHMSHSTRHRGTRTTGTRAGPRAAGQPGLEQFCRNAASIRQHRNRADDHRDSSQNSHRGFQESMAHADVR